MGEPQELDQWARVIQPCSSYLIIGDVGAGKSGLAYFLLERFGKRYSLLPAVVGFPRDKQKLLPSGFVVLDEPGECAEAEDAIVFIDEADIQLPMDDKRHKQYVVNFLSLPRHRNQIFILAFHFPRLVLGTYLPFFNAFLLKRPPYLLEFAGKDQSKAVMGMMERAEERFSELSSEDVVKSTYVVAPRMRWQGMLQNGLPSFWTDELSKVWAGTKTDISSRKKQLGLPSLAELEEIPNLPTHLEEILPEEVIMLRGKPLMDDTRKFYITKGIRKRGAIIEIVPVGGGFLRVRFREPEKGVIWTEFRKGEKAGL